MTADELKALQAPIKARYKELAERALDILVHVRNRVEQHEDLTISFRPHEVYYRLAENYYNLWDYDSALPTIEKAISLAREEGNTIAEDEYYDFKELIEGRNAFYSRNPFLDRRR